MSHSSKATLFYKFIKFFLFAFIVLVSYSNIFDIKHNLNNNNYTVVNNKSDNIEFVVENKIEHPIRISERSTKFILLWTSPKKEPFVHMGEGQKGFIDRKCLNTTCFVTGDRNLLGDYTEFDVVAFLGPVVVNMSKDQLPQRRSPYQKFVFATIESADYYPVCSERFDGFFNWTWTFRLDSVAQWGYVVVRDSNGTVIGPKKEMHWINFKDMDPVSEDFKEKLKSKRKAVAWFVSNCHSRSKREEFVRDLENELKNYHLSVDVYGKCGPLKCPRGKYERNCTDMLETDYYFYLSFENSFDEDYVTEKLLTALKHNTIPVVYGGANYTRFMPKGIYLNARELGVEKLAKEIKRLIEIPEEYAEYFRWKKYYSYHTRRESAVTNDYCRFCSMVNDEKMLNTVKMYPNFRQWWDPPNRC